MQENNYNLNPNNMQKIIANLKQAKQGLVAYNYFLRKYNELIAAAQENHDSVFIKQKRLNDSINYYNSKN
jgi:hypothetical protein